MSEEFRHAMESLPPDHGRDADRSRPAEAAGGRWAPRAVAGLVALHLVVIASTLPKVSPTGDELAHLPAGITFWDRGTFQLYPHNPPLVRLLFSLPAYLLTPVMNYGGAWHDARPGERPEFRFGHEFIVANADRYMRYFIAARRIVALLSAGTGLVLFLWGKAWKGPYAGLLAAAVYLTDPNILGHAGIATVDIGTTFFMTLAGYAFWRFLDRPGPRRLALAGIALGLAQLAKFTSLLLCPAFFLVQVAWGLTARVERPFSLGALARTWAALGVISLLVIDSGYAWEEVGEPLGRLPFRSSLLAAKARPAGTGAAPVNRFAGSMLGRVRVPLPRYYLLGLDAQINENNQIYVYFFDGQVRRTPCWYYYLYCLLFKLPPGTLVFMTGAILLLPPRSDERFWRRGAVFAIIPVALGLYFALLVKFHWGFRYLFPALPYVWLPAAACWTARGSRWAGKIAACAVGVNMACCAAAYPEYISYFNGLDPRPNADLRLFGAVDLDWGQDYFRVRDWLRSNPQPPPRRLFVALSGSVMPRLAGIGPYELPAPDMRLARTATAGARDSPAPEPGLYIISASLAHGIDSGVFDFSCWPHLLDGRHVAYLRALRPGRIGGSVLVYDVSPAESKRIRATLVHEGDPSAR